MIILSERVSNDEALKIPSYRLSLFMDRNMMEYKEFEELGRRIFEEYNKYFIKASTVYTEIPKIRTNSVTGKKENFETKKYITGTKTLERVTAFKLKEHLTHHFIQRLKIPNKDMAIYERGITQKEYFLSFTGKFDFKDFKSQHRIPEELFNHLLNNNLILVIADDDKAYSKIYEFTDKYYSRFYEFLGFRISRPLFHAIVRSYKEEDLDIKLKDHDEFYKEYGDETSIINPKFIKEKREIDRKKSVSHFIDD